MGGAPGCIPTKGGFCICCLHKGKGQIERPDSRLRSRFPLAEVGIAARCLHSKTGARLRIDFYVPGLDVEPRQCL